MGGENGELLTWMKYYSKGHRQAMIILLLFSSEKVNKLVTCTGCDAMEMDEDD